MKAQWQTSQLGNVLATIRGVSMTPNLIAAPAYSAWIFDQLALKISLFQADFGNLNVVGGGSPQHVSAKALFAQRKDLAGVNPSLRMPMSLPRGEGV